MFNWMVPDKVWNQDMLGRPVLFDAFLYDTLLGLDTPTGDYLAKVPLRESGEDDSMLFVMEPDENGVKDHHAGGYHFLNPEFSLFELSQIRLLDSCPGSCSFSKHPQL